MVFILDLLPVEIYSILFEYLWANDIFHSLWNISEHINGAINNYNNYYLDFRHLHKNIYDHILRNLRKQIKCLVISNHISVPRFACIHNFLTLNDLSEFIRLEKLAIIDTEEEYFLVILSNISRFRKLKSLKLDRIPSYTGSRFNRILSRLHRLDLPDATFFDKLSEEVIPNLKCLSVNRCTFRQLEHLFRILPQRAFQSFALNNGILSTIEDNEWPRFNRVPNQLKQINLQIDFQAITFTDLTNLLKQLLHLTVINIKGEGDMDLVNGWHWEKFLFETYGNQLIKFDFCFTIWSYPNMNISETLERFSRPYWLNRVNPWYVAYNGRGIIYTIPLYAVSCSRSDVILTRKATINDEKIFFNSVTQLMILNPNKIPKYRFDNVKFLRITEDAYDSTLENISSIVDLTKIHHLEIAAQIPSELIESMPNLYCLSLININSLLSSLYKIDWSFSFTQVRVLNIDYNATDHRYTDVSPEVLYSLFPNITQLSIAGINIRQAYLNRIIDGFPRMIYGRFQIHWDKQKKDEARKTLERETFRLISYEDRTNFSCHFELSVLHLFIWDTEQ